MLSDIRVLDLTDEKGSFCSRLLADLGASVIRIECANQRPEYSTTYSYRYLNLNKTVVSLDFSEEEGRKSFVNLAKEADVLIKTSPAGHIEDHQPEYEELRQLNPRLICISITAPSCCGPADNPCSGDLIASATGGQMYVMGDAPPGRPTFPAMQQSYYAGSLFAAVQVLLALAKRSKSGEGTCVDVSLQESVAATLDYVLIYWFYDKRIAVRQGNLYGNSYFCILPCKNGFIQITLLQQWDTFVELLAAENMAKELGEPVWNDEAYRIRNIKRIIEICTEWAKTHTVEELFELGQAMRFPWAPLCSIDDVLHSPQLNARQFFAPIKQTTNDPLFCPTLPFQFSGYRKRPLCEINTIQNNIRYSWPQQVENHITEYQRSKLRSSAPALSGLRVLDFTWLLAGPYCTRILADAGAEVIKIQSAKTAKGAETNNGGYFSTWNRNKRSITLDLSHPEARAIVLRLAAIGDVVIENFSPRVMSNWDLSYERFRQVKSDIVMASISAMGRTGPWKDYTGYGPTFHALSGLTALTCAGRQTPIGIGHAYADTVIGLYSAVAVMAALRYRTATGTGQHIDISGYEVMCSCLGPCFLEAQSRDLAGIQNASAPFGCYRCAGDDRWCVFSAHTEEQWNALCSLMGNPQWTALKEFSSPADRVRNRLPLDRNIEAWTSVYQAEILVNMLQKSGIPAGVVENAKDLSRDGELLSRNFFLELDHPVLGKTTSDRSALRFTSEETSKWRAAPSLGEANQYVFTELLGINEAELGIMINKGVIL
ncbi:MAG TPA: CoA transferase [Syntrophorhabdaceae bacterium]|nr:CoA transferase [Syntrophorhabdaceae bacterium]